MGVAQAQPEQEPAPIVPNPPNATAQGAPQTPEQKAQQMEEIMKKAQEEGMELMKLPPDQMRARIWQMQEQALRAELDRLGFKEKTLQDRILGFVAEQEKSRETVRVAGAKVMTAMSAPAKATSEQALTALLEDYLGSADDAIDQREVATAKLDADIGWSRNARLRSFLTLKGFIGQGAWLTGDVMMTGMLSMGSLAQMGAAPK